MVAVGVAAVAVSGLVGCSVPGDATAVALFDACAEIPDDALVAAGLDPATEEPGIYGTQVDGWLMCTWDADWYFLTVAGTEMPMDEVVANSSNTGFRDVVVGGRQAVEHDVTSDTENETCILAFEGPGGVTMLRLDKKGSESMVEPPCVALERDAVPLIAHLPA